jgi:hypothetical protein
MTKPLAKCQKCGKLAVWEYAPSDGVGSYCDECVPRGCSCNVIDHRDESPDAEQDRDELGRLMPCVEYWFWPDGFEILDEA